MTTAVARARAHIAEGYLQQAAEACAEALSAEPKCAEALHLLGVIGATAGSPRDAAGLIRGAIHLSPGVAEFHHDLGAIFRKLGQLEEARGCFEQAIRLAPDWAKPHLSLGNLLREQGDHQAALQAFVRALQLAPDAHEVEYNVGIELLELDRIGEAEEYLGRAVQHMPECAEAHFNLGKALQRLRKWSDAEVCFRRVLQLADGCVEALNQLGITLAETRRYAEAQSVLEQALRLEPDSAMVHSNLGNVFLKEDRFAEALTHVQRALVVRPDFAEAWNNLGGCVLGTALARADETGLEEAERCYRHALELSPEDAAVRMNLALLHLSMGRYEEGWREYEWRRRRSDFPKLDALRPAWEGESLEGRSILLQCEAGLGDSIHFVRYAQLVKRRGARVILRCPEALRPLFAGCVGIDLLINQEADIPWHDVYAPLMSLPHILGTSVDTMPGDIHYIHADPDRVAYWREHLADYSGLRVGISWQGNPDFKGDRRRSFALQCLEPLARVPDVQLFSLQTGFGQEQLALVPKWNVVDLGLPFVEKAAVAMNLDLVITCDTAVAHLAGALGRPVWTALSFLPDFRWLLGRSDTPWYPTMRLYRQSRPGEWRPVFEAMAEHLAETAAAFAGPSRRIMSSRVQPQIPR